MACVELEELAVVEWYLVYLLVLMLVHSLLDGMFAATEHTWHWLTLSDAAMVCSNRSKYASMTFELLAAVRA